MPLLTEPSDLHSLLQPIPDASHTRDLNKSPPNSTCYPGTRVGVVDKITLWAKGPTVPQNHIYVLHGYASCGKSAISQKVSEILQEDNKLGCSFFFFHNSGDRSTMSRFATTLASQLASKSYWMHHYIKAAVDAEPSLLASSTSLKVQLDRLVYQPFQDATWWRFTTWWHFTAWCTWWRFVTVPFVIVIDGLDECEDRKGVDDFVDSMLEFVEKNPSTLLRFFITTRVEQHIHSKLKVDEVHLEDLASHGSRKDILLFMLNSFRLAAKRDRVIKAYVQENGNWPQPADTDALVNHIGGSFIFASDLSKYILGPATDNLTPMQRLPLTLKMDPKLDDLYSRTLARSQDLPHFFDIISAIALLEDPLPISSLAELLGLKSYEIIHVLVDLQAIIQLPGTEEDKPITLCHASLRDYLTTESRSRCFFAPPRFQIRLAYLCFSLQISKIHPVSEATEANLNASNYAIKYGHVHWTRYWTEHQRDFGLEEARLGGGGSESHRKLFLALGFIQSHIGMPTLHPSVREYMTLNWPEFLASAVQLDPSFLIEGAMKIPIGCPLQKATNLELPIDTHGAVFSVSAHLFDALNSNVDLAARSIQTKIGKSSLSLSLTGPSQIIRERDKGDTKSIALDLLVPWRVLSALDLFKVFRWAVERHRVVFLGEGFRLVLLPQLTGVQRELEVITMATTLRSPFGIAPSLRLSPLMSMQRVAGNW